MSETPEPRPPLPDAFSACRKCGAAAWTEYGYAGRTDVTALRCANCGRVVTVKRA